MKYEQFDGVEDPDYGDSKSSYLPLIGCVVCFLLLLLGFLLFFFLGIPIIIQNNVDGATMYITNVNMSTPTTDTISFNVDGYVTPNPSLTFTMETPAGWKVSFRGIDVGVLDVPSPSIVFYSSQPINNFTFGSVLTVTNQDGFDAMGAAIIREKEVNITFSASFSSKWLGYSFSGIDFEKNVTFKGFGNFASATLDLDFTTSTMVQTNVISKFSFNNPGTITSIESLGDIALILSSEEGSRLASISSQDTSIDEETTIIFSGPFSPTNLDITGRVLGQYYGLQNLTFNIKGISSSESIWTGVIASIDAFPRFAPPPRPLFTNTTWSRFGILPVSNDEIRLEEATFRSYIDQLTGPNANFSVQSIGIRNLQFLSPNGNLWATSTFPSVGVNYKNPDSTAPFRDQSVVVRDNVRLAAFVNSVFNGTKGNMRIEGDLDMVATFPFGQITMPGIKLNRMLLEIKGQSIQCPGLRFRKDTADKKAITSEIKCDQLGGDFSINLGNVFFDVFYAAELMGHIRGPIKTDLSKGLTWTGAYWAETVGERGGFGRMLEDSIKGIPDAGYFQAVNSSFDFEWIRNFLPQFRFTSALVAQKIDVITSMGFSKDRTIFKPTQIPTLTATVSLTTAFPFEFSYTVPKTKVVTILSFNSTPFATFEPDFVVSNITGKVVSFTIPETPLPSLNPGAYSDFASTILNGVSAPTTINGTSDMVLNTVIGDVPITGIEVAEVFTFGGLRAFAPPVVADFNFLSATATTVSMTISLNLTNPSNSSYSFGVLAFDALFNNAKVATVNYNFTNAYQPGLNVINGVFTLPTGALSDQFLSALVASSAVPFPNQGVTTGTQIQQIANGIALVRLPLVLPNTERLITKSSLFISFNDIVDGKPLPLLISARNPSDLPLQFTGTLTLGANSSVVGTAPVTFTINPRSAITQTYNVALQAGVTFDFLSSLFGPPQNFHFNGTVVLKIGDYSTGNVAFSSVVPTTLLSNKKRVDSAE